MFALSFKVVSKLSVFALATSAAGGEGAAGERAGAKATRGGGEDPRMAEDQARAGRDALHYPQSEG